MAARDGIEIRLDGTLTVATAETVHRRLVAALAERRDITVDCGHADAVDLSLVQVIVAARAAAEAKGVALTLRSPASGALLEALRRGGFLADEADARRFWMKEDV